MSRTVHGEDRVAGTELARLVASVEDGDVLMRPDQRLGEFLDSWLAFVEWQRSPTAVRGCRDKVRRRKAVLGGVRVSKLTAQDLDRAYARWLEAGASLATVHHCHRVLANALRQAQRWGLVTRCVTDLARPPASISRPAPDMEPERWQAVVVDLQEREPVTAMA